jgi:RNA polymerase sigma factor (sigma-70 family)
MVRLQALRPLVQAIRRWARQRRSSRRARPRLPVLEYLEDRLCPAGLFGAIVPVFPGLGSAGPIVVAGETAQAAQSQAPPAATVFTLSAAGDTGSWATSAFTADVSASFVVQTAVPPPGGTTADVAVSLLRGTDSSNLDFVFHSNGSDPSVGTGPSGEGYQIHVIPFSELRPPLAALPAMPPARQPVPESTPNSVVTPSITLQSGVAATDAAPVAPVRLFRIDRMPADGPPLEVPYQLRLYQGSGVVRHDGEIVLADGAANVGLRLDWAPLQRRDASAFVVLTLAEQPSYQLARPAVTMFTTPAPEQYGEAVLLDAFRQGQSPEAFAALVGRYRGMVLQTCLQVLGNRPDAEDATQLVFLTLAERHMRLQVTLARWLRVVARNAAIMVLRARRRRARHERAMAPPEPAPLEVANEEIREELDAALRLVPPALQEAVRLRYLEGRSQKEAAEIAGCPRGTIAQRAANGVRRLRNVLNQRDNLFP